MKTFLRENKSGLFFLGTPILCLIVLWSVNFYKLSYEYVEWKNLGMPFGVPARKLGSIVFPNHDPIDLLTPDGFIGDSPQISVWAVDGIMYSLDWQDRWWTAGFLPFPTENMIDEGVDCAARLRSKWRLPEEIPQDADVVEARGLCDNGKSQYAVYRIKQNGEVWEKYVSGRDIGLLRSLITILLFLFLIFSSPFWIDLFNNVGPLKPHPEYDAKKRRTDMRTFLQKNKLRLLLLVALFLGLIAIWNVNIYKIRWNYFTPWKDLGAPPSPAREIRYVRFPDTYVRGPGVDSLTYYYQSEPTIDIVAMDDKVYSSGWNGQWSQTEYDYAPVYPAGKVHKWECAEKIESLWGLDDEGFPNATSVFIQGKCPKGDSYQYAVYLISNNGNILGKYLEDEEVEYFRIGTTIYAIAAIFLCIAVWGDRFKTHRLLSLQPDYDAK